MDEKIDEVIKQYELHLLGKRRIRGGLLLETKEGEYTLTSYRENAARVTFDELVKEMLIEKGYLYVDQGIKNINGEWLTKDHMGNRWHMKKWYAGKECNLKEEEEVYRAAGHLGKLHQLLELPEKAAVPYDYLSSSREKDTVSDTDNAFSLIAASVEVESRKKEPELIITWERDTGNLFMRRSREMRRVYNYIRHKKKKNEMEICILNLFPEFSDQAGEAEEELKCIDYKTLLGSQLEEGKIFHGSYNYHNILFDGQQIITTNFEKSAFGIQIMDLYGFLRKFLEKNNWNISQGMHAIEAYQKNRSLGKEEGVLLYVLFLFPEKFWKQMNFYYNGKKSWMSMKNLDKIKKIEQQEKERRKFLREAKRVLIS